MASKLRRVRKYQWNSGKRLRKHGRRARMQSSGGQRVINARRRKGRHELTVQRPQKKSIKA